MVAFLTSIIANQIVQYAGGAIGCVFLAMPDRSGRFQSMIS